MSILNKKPLVSVIVRSYNEEKWIGACLKGIFSQDYENIEVILVDNNSTDRTVEKAKQFDITLLNIDDFLPGLALNMGIRASRGEYFVCISAHCIPVNDSWLKNLLANFEDDSVAGVYGRQEPLAFTPDTDKRDLLTIFGLDKRTHTKDSFFHNANSMIKRSVWDEYPFDEKITNIEDRLWAREVLRAGYKTVYEPTASVYHYHGIHQGQNKERCARVVKIIEELNREDGRSFKTLELDKLNIVAIVPVKGDVLKIHNKPLLEYTIEHAKESKYINSIVLSTDSEEHAEIARKAGIDVPFLRDKSLSEDYVDLGKVYQYTLSRLEESGVFPDIIVALEITFPFRPKGLIDELILRHAKEGWESMIPGRTEFASCWQKEGSVLKRLDAGFIPRVYKEPMYVGIEGLGCVTYPEFIRDERILGNNVGVLELKHPFSFLEVRDKMGEKVAETVFDHWRETQN